MMNEELLRLENKSLLNNIKEMKKEHRKTINSFILSSFIQALTFIVILIAR